jgi:hypothetical protein
MDQIQAMKEEIARIEDDTLILGQDQKIQKKKNQRTNTNTLTPSL